MKCLPFALMVSLLVSMPMSAEAASPVAIAYGADQLQKLDFYPAPKPGAPLVIFIHGGA